MPMGSPCGFYLGFKGGSEGSKGLLEIIENSFLCCANAALMHGCGVRVPSSLCGARDIIIIIIIIIILLLLLLIIIDAH
jgi:hypothetical protein